MTLPFLDSYFAKLEQQFDGVLSEKTFTNEKIIDRDVSSSIFAQINVLNSSFDNFFCKDVLMFYCTFSNCTFLETGFRKTEFHYCQFYDCTFVSSDFSRTEFLHTSLNRCKFQDSDLIGTYFSHCKLSDLELENNVMMGICGSSHVEYYQDNKKIDFSDLSSSIDLDINLKEFIQQLNR